MAKQCSVCGVDAVARSLCNAHWKIARKNGDFIANIVGDDNKRFWSYVEKSAGCWRWIGSLASTGYGQIQIGGRLGKNVGAHRLSYQMHFGRIADGLQVCHTCDNRWCVNPAHFFLGTIADNLADAKRKGRNARGDKVSGSKLTESAVISIRNDPSRTRELAAKYGVSACSIRKIKTRATWAHVKP